ncbi:MAG: GTPase Era [Gammaproteobacteria bacterium]|nr:GTPase Era [Gammaproteobacteria bacterium]
MTKSNFKSGYVALLGRPNTGKSTLMNAMVGEKISITAHKPQTTRHQILGIKTTADYQCVFVDTPGIHTDQKKAINRYMNRAAKSMMDDVDLVCLLIEANKFTQEDEKLIESLKNIKNVVFVLNKIDMQSKAACLPLMQRLAELRPNTDVLPVSALKEDNLDRLEAVICEYLPESTAHYPEDQLTDKSMRFIAAEIIREKIFREFSAELPYATTVDIDHYVEEHDMTRISASIWVERKSQKGIVIGKQGKTLKKIGSMARAGLEDLLQQKVYLQLWVKVREGWSDDERSLQSFGYTSD